MKIEEYVNLRDWLWLFRLSDMKQKKSSDNLKNHPLAGTWNQMLDRCYNPYNNNFPNYGARGIDVCECWFSLKNFISDMGDKEYSLSLDRINNDLGYSPENCRWASYKEQAKNKRKDKLIEARKRISNLFTNSRSPRLLHGVNCLGGYR